MAVADGAMKIIIPKTDCGGFSMPIDAGGCESLRRHRLACLVVSDTKVTGE